MPGHGPAPKPASERRNRNPKQRGEWREIAPIVEPVLGDLPSGTWPERTRDLWESWRNDPATRLFSATECALAVELAYSHAAAVVAEKDPLTSEFRQWTDRLGLNPKGKLDLRLRVVEPEPEPEAERAPATVRRLRAVDPAG